MLLHTTVVVQNLFAVFAHRARRRVEAHRFDDAGQTTAEYALVLIAAAAVAVLVITWASKTDLISKLMDFVVGKITGRAE